MKLFVVNLLLGMCLISLPATSPGGSVRCKCRPSPPGGVTECHSGQLAVCGGRSGVCKGSCISLDARLQPLQYSAALLTKVLDQDISVEDLKKDPKVANRKLLELIKSSQKNKTVKLEHNGKEYLVSVGLTEVAISKLKAASGALVVKKRVRIPITIGRVHP